MQNLSFIVFLKSSEINFLVAILWCTYISLK